MKKSRDCSVFFSHSAESVLRTAFISLIGAEKALLECGAVEQKIVQIHVFLYLLGEMEWNLAQIYMILPTFGRNSIFI